MSNKIFYSTKTFNTDRGLSCCFRQWRSTHSHCSLLHGYSIGIKLTFGCESLDERNWVQDFGGIKKFKEWAEYMFDHTLVIAEDDPMLEDLKMLGTQGLADIRVVPAVGCERFAELCFDKISQLLRDEKQLNPTAFIQSVEVFEHGANSAICVKSDVSDAEPLPQNRSDLVGMPVDNIIDEAISTLINIQATIKASYKTFDEASKLFKNIKPPFFK